MYVCMYIYVYTCVYIYIYTYIYIYIYIRVIARKVCRSAICSQVGWGMRLQINILMYSCYVTVCRYDYIFSRQVINKSTFGCLSSGMCLRRLGTNEFESWRVPNILFVCLGVFVARKLVNRGAMISWTSRSSPLERPPGPARGGGEQ